tara:strand:+ start:520 stop:864 length:345 start_codon:yes stop_codon:yes gene_type:complete
MKAGKLNKRLTLQRFDGSTNARGQPDYNAAANWDDQADVWGQVEPLSGREAERARKIFADATVRVTVRYHSTAKPTAKDRWQLKSDGRLFYIGHVLDENLAHRQIVTLCGESPA